ncbi:MAG: hypothetical protein J2P26_02845 [Nocardiopsaceae bacterium]|nr:hypothetical protein [Nocardiopsaceae bacterium]
MGSQYLISRRWALASRFAITDDEGTPRFEVQGRLALARRLSVRDAGGAEVAVILRRGLGMRYRILTDGQETAVRPRGFLGRRFEIDTPAGPMEARGNFSGRQYAITQGGVPVAEVAQLRTLREQFAVHIADGQDAVLMLAVILVIETIRDNRRRAAGSG